jgi:hypothetical protein
MGRRRVYSTPGPDANRPGYKTSQASPVFPGRDSRAVIRARARSVSRRQDGKPSTRDDDLPISLPGNADTAAPPGNGMDAPCRNGSIDAPWVWLLRSEHGGAGLVVLVVGPAAGRYRRDAALRRL